MKGIHGLILALGLGIAGALFNWAYLNRKTSEVEQVAFVGIKPNVTINAGEKLIDDHVVPVPVPEKWVGSLKDYAYLWSVRGSVVSMPVYRNVQGPTILWKLDMKPPPPALQFNEVLREGEEERAIFVPVDTRDFVPSLVNPGDYVDFLISRGGYGEPTPAGGGDPPTAGEKAPSGNVEIVGPFKILSLGNRVGNDTAWEGTGKKPTQENVWTISVKLENGVLEKKAQTLLDLLEMTKFRQVRIMIRPPGEKPK
jgi:Flp pilus assembly protein CpaB